MRDMEYLMRGYRLTTAEILYHLPDYPGILQSYLWQEYDETPHFPILMRFLDFWECQLEGKLYCVKVASDGLIRPREILYAKKEIWI